MRVCAWEGGEGEIKKDLREDIVRKRGIWNEAKVCHSRKDRSFDPAGVSASPALARFRLKATRGHGDAAFTTPFSHCRTFLSCQVVTLQKALLSFLISVCLDRSPSPSL